MWDGSGGDYLFCALAYCVNATAVTSVTVNLLSGGSSFSGGFLFGIHEFSGIAAGTGIDAAASSIVVSTVTTLTTPSITLGGTADAVVALTAPVVGWTSVASPFTLITTNNLCAAWDITSSTGAISAAFTGSSQMTNGGVIMALGGGGTTYAPAGLPTGKGTAGSPLAQVPPGPVLGFTSVPGRAVPGQYTPGYPLPAAGTLAPEQLSKPAMPENMAGPKRGSAHGDFCRHTRHRSNRCHRDSSSSFSRWICQAVTGSPGKTIRPRTFVKKGRATGASRGTIGFSAAGVTATVAVAANTGSVQAVTGSPGQVVRPRGFVRKGTSRGKSAGTLGSAVTGISSTVTATAPAGSIQAVTGSPGRNIRGKPLVNRGTSRNIPSAQPVVLSIVTGIVTQIQVQAPAGTVQAVTGSPGKTTATGICPRR